MSAPAPAYAVEWIGKTGGVTADGYAVSVFEMLLTCEVVIVVHWPSRRFPAVIVQPTRELALAEAVIRIADDRRLRAEEARRMAP